MEITVNEDQQIQFERAFNDVKFVTVNGEELSVCMRDTGYELVYEGTPIELKNGVINESQSARIRELEETLWKIRETVVSVPELKMLNYSENDVERLNNAMIEIWDILEALRKTEIGGE